jgi:hypothetical protein
MAEETKPDVTIALSASGLFYCMATHERECGLWLGVEKKPLPVPSELRRPGTVGAAIMRGRDYWRHYTRTPLGQGDTKTVPADDDLVTDYRDAAWWTPGLEEAWAEADGLHESLRTMEVNFKSAVEQTKADTQAQDAAAATDHPHSKRHHNK